MRPSKRISSSIPSGPAQGVHSITGSDFDGIQHACIHLGHQGLGGAAVWQGDGLLDQPDDVAGELGHLLGAERNAWAQLVLLGKGGARIHQGLVLRFLVAVAGQEALAGELGDLLVDQALLVKAIAQALFPETFPPTNYC